MKFAKILGFPRASDKPNDERALGTRMGGTYPYTLYYTLHMGVPSKYPCGIAQIRDSSSGHAQERQDRRGERQKEEVFSNNSVPSLL